MNQKVDFKLVLGSSRVLIPFRTSFKNQIPVHGFTYQSFSFIESSGTLLLLLIDLLEKIFHTKFYAISLQYSGSS